MWGMYSGVKANEKHDGGNEKILGSSGDALQTPQVLKILLLDIGMLGMYNGGKDNKKHNGANENNVGTSDNDYLTPYKPLIGLNIFFCIRQFSYPLTFTADT